MKDNNHILTPQETEQLCRLYLDCALSVQEETELQYVLGKLPYSSPIIDDVRAMMGIQSLMPQMRAPSKRKMRAKVWTRPLYIGIAASVALLLGIGIPAIYKTSTSGNTGEPLYIAYSDGQRMNDEQSMIQVQADMKRAEEFMRHIEELETREQEKLEHFITINTSEQ